MPSYFAYFGGGTTTVLSPVTPGIYWAPTYWAPTYFASGYWSAAVPADLLEAIYRAFYAAGLKSAFPGDLWIDRAPDGTAYPFAVISVASDSADFDTGDVQARQVEVQFSAYHTDKELARKARVLLRTEFLPTNDDWSPLSWGFGRELQRFPSGQTLNLDPDPGVGGVDLWAASFTVLFTCEESFGSGS